MRQSTLALLLLLGGRSAAAGLAVDRPVDLAVLGGAGALWLGSELLLKDSLAPASCRWCDTDRAGGDDLNGFDRAVRSSLVWDASLHSTARLLSNVLAYGGTPAIMAGVDWLTQGDGPAALDDTIVMLEAGVAAAVLNQAVKLVAGRSRPEVHFDPCLNGTAYCFVRPDHGDRNDENLSFYSGHTTFTFSTSTAMVTALALRGRTWWPAAAVGWPLAFATGYFRIAADKHYTTDVLTGALLGAAVGAGVVLLHRDGTEGGGASFALTATGLAVRGSF